MMAIDSPAKRKSVVAIGLIMVGPVVVPDGSFDQFDRQVIGYGYGGILAGEAADTTAGFICVRGSQLTAPYATASLTSPVATATLRCTR